MTLKEFKAKYPEKIFEQVLVRRKCEWIPPYVGLEDIQTVQVADEGWEIYLDHSCGDWVIGNLSDALTFSENLMAAIQYCKSNP